MTQLWEFLRPFTEMAIKIDTPTKIVVTLLSLALLAIAILAYRKNPSKRLLIVSAAFLFFALKWLVKIIDIFFSPGTFLADSSENIFELIILGLLFFALLKK